MRWVARSAVVPAGCWGVSGLMGAALALLLLPLCLAAVARRSQARVSVWLCLLATEHQVPQAFSCKPCCYLRSPLSFMVRAKAEFISRLHLQQMEREISWEQGGGTGATRLVGTGVPRRHSPQLGFPSHEPGFCKKEIYNFNKKKSIVRCLWLFCCLGDGKERCPI